jgi:phosphosulfolactate phosphohydrolase-like enzyme
VERLEHFLARQRIALILREGAQIARLVKSQAGSAAEVLARSEAGQAISQVGLGHDLAMCAAVDASESMPLVQGPTPAGLLVVHCLNQGSD